MKQLAVASTFYQCVSLAAAVDAAALPAVDGERVLVLANSAQAPELGVRLQDQQGFDHVRRRFDRIIDLAALVYPRRPQQFSPRGEDLTAWHNVLRTAWDLGGEPVQLVMDSVHVNPSLALAQIFFDAALYAHADGLMVYAPTRSALPASIEQRLAGLVYVDLVPGLRPALLTEHGINQVPIPPAAVREVIDGISAPGGPSTSSSAGSGRRSALILGQYLPSLGLLSRQEELHLHGAILAEAVSRGFRHCVFKPHPSAPPAAWQMLLNRAAELGVTVELDRSPSIAEVATRQLKPDLVLSCFSTGLATARYLFGLSSVAVGTEDLLAKLAPYENSNRIPVVLADALFSEGFYAPADQPPGIAASRDLQALVHAVAYCMQSVRLARHADTARQYLTAVTCTDPLPLKYFKRRRLTALQLPGGLPARSARRRLSRVWGASTRTDGSQSGIRR